MFNYTLIKQLFNIWLCLCLLTACGFQLRGDYQFAFKTAMVSSEGADSAVALVSQALNEVGVRTVTVASDAEALIYLRNLTNDRRILSVSAVTGKLEEVELNLRLELEVFTPNKDKILLPKQGIHLSREYSFDVNAVLAKDAEEQLLRTEMQREALAHILRRLQSIK